MADSPVFEWVCGELEQRTNLERLAARGTVRLALKKGGLDASAVSRDQMMVIIQKVLPEELGSRGVENSEAVCSTLSTGLSRLQVDASPSESPDEVFQRLGG